MRDRFDVAFANDPDADRHGIVTPSRRAAEPEPLPRGLHRLPVRRRAATGATDVGIGKTLVSLEHDRPRRRATSGAGSSRCRSASSGSSTGCSTARSASAARRAPARRSCAATARPGRTDKDGLIPCLLAAEMTARDGQRPGRALRASSPSASATPAYRRIDVAATPEREGRAQAALARAGRGRRAGGRADHATMLTEAPGNGAPIGGLKVVAEHGWFAARPSGTEDVYKVYAESLDGEEHLERILAEARGDRRQGAGGAWRWPNVLDDRAGRRRGQAAGAADARPRQARRAVRRQLPADRLRALEPGQRRATAGSSC